MKIVLSLMLLIPMINAAQKDDLKCFKDSFAHFIKDLKGKTANDMERLGSEAHHAYYHLPAYDKIDEHLTLLFKCEKNARHSYWCWSLASYMKKISLIGEEYGGDQTVITILNNKVKTIDSQLQKPGVAIEEWTDEDIKKVHTVSSSDALALLPLNYRDRYEEGYLRNKCQNVVAGLSFPEGLRGIFFSEYHEQWFESCTDVIRRIDGPLNMIDYKPKPWFQSKAEKELTRQVVDKLERTRRNVVIQKEEEIFEMSKQK